MIDNTVIIRKSIRIAPRINKVFVALVTNDIDYDTIDEVNNHIPIKELWKVYNADNELILTATDEFEHAIQYNRIFFVDKFGQIENVLVIETKTQRLVRIDLKLTYKVQHTIGSSICES